ncbi:MAG TPA: hypothetical protein VGE72_10485 [Azospirillum sp.]
MSATPDPSKTRHVSVRLPEVLAHQVELVRGRQRLRHFSDALVYALDRGLAAIAREGLKPDRLEILVTRIDDLLITVLAILNVAHEGLDEAAVREMRAAILETLQARDRAARADAHPVAKGFDPLGKRAGGGS